MLPLSLGIGRVCYAVVVAFFNDVGNANANANANANDNDNAIAMLCYAMLYYNMLYYNMT